MATLRDNILPIVNRGREIAEEKGLRQHRVFVVTEQWSVESNLGTLVQSSTEILPRPKVEPTSPNKLRVSKITPSHVGGGYAPSQILPAIASGKQLLYVVRGPDGVDVPYVLENVESNRSFGYVLHLAVLHWQQPEF